MKKHFLFFAIVIMSAFVQSSCKSGGENPGRIFMPDMTYSNAYEAYASTKFQYQSDTDAMSAILPIANTIPRGYLPMDEEIRKDEAKLMAYLFKNYFENPMMNHGLNDAEERARAASMLKNPIVKSDEVLAEGKAKYDIYCAVCHGKKGQGDGTLLVLADGTDGAYTAVPPAYETRLPGLTDGEIFYSISYGKNMMGGYYAQVSVEDRWKILHYIKDMAGIATTSEVAVVETPVVEVVE